MAGQIVEMIVVHRHVGEVELAAVAHGDAVTEGRQIRTSVGDHFVPGRRLAEGVAVVRAQETSDLFGHTDVGNPITRDTGVALAGRLDRYPVGIISADMSGALRGFSDD